MKQIRIKKDDVVPETTEVLAKAVLQIADASQQLLKTGLTLDGLVTLLHRKLPSVSRGDIQLVLESLPKLKGWYCRG